MSRRRIRAIFLKELREYRRNGNIVAAMAILPMVFVLQPLIQVFTLSAGAAPTIRDQHALVYLLAIPVLVPATLAAYAIVGERLQGTLEPLLSTPIRRDELPLGKALAAFVPSVAIAYAVFAAFVIIVEIFAQRAVASALIQGPALLADIVFTPLLAGWSIWVGIAVSARASDPRTASQVALVASLPPVVITTLIAFNVIPSGIGVAVAFGALLVVLVRVGWRVASALFDRERLITSTK